MHALTTLNLPRLVPNPDTTMNTIITPITRQLPRLALPVALALVAAFASPAQAADVIKANNTTALNLTGSWTGAVLPTSSDVAVWDSTVTAANSPLAGASLSWAGIRIANPTGLVTIGGATPTAGTTLTLGVSGIDLSAATQSAVISSPTTLLLGASQTWSVNSTRNLRLGITGTGAANANLDGTAGTVITVTGGGVVDANQGGATGFTDAAGYAGFNGKWIVNSGATLRGLRHGATAWGTSTAADAITLNGGTLAVGGIATAAGNWSWNSGITLATSTSSILDNQNPSGSGRWLKLVGAFTGSGNLTIASTGAGTMSSDTGFIFAAPNTMSGTLTINSGAFVRVGGLGGTDLTTSVGSLGSLGTATIVNNGTLTLSRDNTWTFANNVSGTGVLRIGIGTGSATHIATVSGNNSHSGGTTLQTAVTLNIGHANALGTGMFTVAGNGIFDNGTGSSLTVANPFTLSGGSPTFTGTSDMTINGAVTLAVANRTITVNGGTLTLGGAVSGAFNLTKQGAGTLVLNGASVAYANAITVGNGTLRLGSADALGTIAGGTTVSSGGTLDLNGQTIIAETLSITGTGVGSNGALVNNSGTPASLSGAITLGGNSSVGGSGNTTLGGAIGGAFSLTKVGAGNVTLNAASTHSGDTTVSAGTLTLGASGSIASSPVITVAGGALLDVSASSFTLGGAQTLVAGRTSGFATDVNGTLTSGGVVRPAGTSTAGTLTVAGALAMTGGSVNFDLNVANTTAGAGVNDLVAASGAVSASASTTVNVNWVGGAPASGTYTLFTGSTASAANLVKGTGLTDGPRISFAFDDTTTPGTIYLVVTGGPASLTWVGDGAGNVWDIGGSPNWDNGGADNYYDLDSVTFNDTSANGPVDVSVTVAPGAVVVNNSSTAYSLTGAGKITGTASLTKSGTASLTVATPNDNSGGTTINGGTVIVPDGGALGSGAVVNNATLQLDSASTLTFNNTVSGTGGLTKTSAGTATVGGVNTYAGNTTISAGTLKIGAGGPIPNGAGKGDVSLTGTLDLAGTGETINGLSGGGTVDNSTGTGTLIVGDNAATSTFGGTIQNTAGTLALTKTGAGTLTLTGANTYGGATTVSGGTLAVSGGSAIPNAATVTIGNGGTFQVNASETIGGLSTVSNSTVNAASGTLTFTTGSIIGNLTGAGTVLRNGTADTAAGQFTNANALNFTGTLSLRGSTPSSSPAAMQGATGRFWLHDPNGSQAAATAFALDTGASGTDAQDVIFGDWDATSGNRKLTLSSLTGFGTLRMDAGSAGLRNVIVDQATDTTFNGMMLSHTSSGGEIVRSLAFEKLGIGTLTLAGIVGRQTVSAGVSDAPVFIKASVGRLVLTAVNTFTGWINIGGSATLELGGAGRLGSGTYSQPVTNAGTFVVNSSANQVLSGVISGAGVIIKTNSGTLTLNGANIYTGATTVSAGTLAGTGTVGGALDVQSGGTLAPGASIGTLTVNGAATLAGVIVAEVTNGPSADLINFAGGATLGGTLTVTANGTLTSGQTFNLMDGSLSGTFATVNLPGGSGHWNTTALYTLGEITFNNASPVATNLSLGVVHGGSVSLTVIGGKHAPTDADGDSMTVTGVGAASSGTSGFTATSVTYVADGTAGTNTFTYTVTDALGATDTKIVTVIVSNPQGFNQVSAGVDGGNAVLSYLGVPGTNYALEITHTLPATNWVPVITNTAAANGFLNFTNPISLSPTNDYYRTRYVP